MSLNCLTCQVLQRTNSDCKRDYVPEKYSKKLFRPEVHERSWSGNLGPPPSHDDKMTNGSTVIAQKNAQKLGRRRLHSTAVLAREGSTPEPRLVRSSGMRRDWSFENLKEREEKKGRIS